MTTALPGRASQGCAMLWLSARPGSLSLLRGAAEPVGPGQVGSIPARDIIGKVQSRGSSALTTWMPAILGYRCTF